LFDQTKFNVSIAAKAQEINTYELVTDSTQFEKNITLIVSIYDGSKLLDSLTKNAKLVLNGFEQVKSYSFVVGKD
jgi:hypothetical protein